MTPKEFYVYSNGEMELNTAIRIDMKNEHGKLEEVRILVVAEVSRSEFVEYIKGMKVDSFTKRDVKNPNISFYKVRVLE